MTYLNDRKTILNALAITDTTQRTGTAFDMENYAQIAIRALNTHNQPLTMNLLRGDAPTDTTWISDKTGAAYSVTLPASMTKPMLITATDWPPLPFLQFANVVVSAAVAPTSGNVTVEVVGIR